MRVVSRAPSRPGRLIDTAVKLLRWGGAIDLGVVDVFSGAAFHMADLSSRLLRLRGVPVVLVLHGGHLPAYFRSHPRRVGRVLRRGCRVAPSGFLSEFFANQGFPTQTIPNILELDSYRFTARVSPAPRLLWMRTLHSLYNPEMAVSVVGRLARDYPDIVLTLAGPDRGARESVQKLIDKEQLSERVKIVGFLDQEAKVKAFAENDVFLNTNRVDNAPVSLLEAAASGLPVVTTAVGGIPYLLEHDKTALLVEDGNIEAMVESVRRILSEPGLAVRLSKGGRQAAEISSWSRVKPKWEELIRRSIGSASADPTLC